MIENELATSVLDCCFNIHRHFGPGLFESVYCAALEQELRRARINFTREHPVHAEYLNTSLGVAFRADFVVSNKIILEIKSVEALAPVHRMQLLTYLKLTNLKLGLLVNFNVALLKDGIIRVVHNL